MYVVVLQLLSGKMILSHRKSFNQTAIYGVILLQISFSLCRRKLGKASCFSMNVCVYIQYVRQTKDVGISTGKGVWCVSDKFVWNIAKDNFLYLQQVDGMKDIQILVIQLFDSREIILLRHVSSLLGHVNNISATEHSSVIHKTFMYFVLVRIFPCALCLFLYRYVFCMDTFWNRCDLKSICGNMMPLWRWLTTIITCRSKTQI